MEETQNIEKKSLRIVIGNTADWNELAKEALLEFITSASIREYQDREIETEQMIIRTICSEQII